MDTLFRVKTLPSGQGKILPYDMLQIAEGMASSAAFTVVRLGGEASIWGAVGDDEIGGRIIRDLAEAGIETDGMVRVSGARSAASTILIDDNGERLIVPYYEPRLHHAPKPLEDGQIAAFDAVMVDIRWPVLAKLVLDAARRVGIPAILDGDVGPNETIDALAVIASHIVFSQPAAEKLAGGADINDTVQVLKQRYPQAFICVTAGQNGSYWFDETEGAVMHVPALRIAAVDTLAAGDVFHGAFALLLTEGKSYPETIRFASVAAAMKCEVFGGRTGTPSRTEVLARMAVSEE
jgi:sugar/nucleoside kinase (ribokinase family)